MRLELGDGDAQFGGDLLGADGELLVKLMASAAAPVELIADLLSEAGQVALDVFRVHRAVGDQALRAGPRQPHDCLQQSVLVEALRFRDGGQRLSGSHTRVQLRGLQSEDGRQVFGRKWNPIPLDLDLGEGPAELIHSLFLHAGHDQLYLGRGNLALFRQPGQTPPDYLNNAFGHPLLSQADRFGDLGHGDSPAQPLDKVVLRDAQNTGDVADRRTSLF